MYEPSKDWKCPHSAEVEIKLDCGPHGVVPLRRVTPTDMESRETQAIPPCAATLIAVVDGDEMRAAVSLPEGFNGTTARAVNVEEAPDAR